jgi:hypothetical protein
MATKSAIAIMELLEVEPMAVPQLVEKSGLSRSIVQERLAEGVSSGRLQRTSEGNGRSLYTFVEKGKPQVWDWTTFPEWKKDDGPVPGVWIDHPQGHLCEWSCTWLMPDGTHKQPEIPSDPEACWWEAQDVIARYKNVPVGADTLLGALAQARFPEDLKGAPLNLVRRALGIARSTMYSGMPFLHPTTIKRTGNAKFPLKLSLGKLRVFSGIGFRPGWQPPGEVTKVLLKYARVPGIMGLLDKLNSEEWPAIAKMAAAFEKMESLTK